MSEPEPRCFICECHSSQVPLTQHGDGPTAFWLCEADDRRATELIDGTDNEAARLLEAARHIQEGCEDT